MTSSARQKFDVLVVGAGPAGMAAAARAAETGVRVGLVDDNFNPGGQIWRGGVEGDNPQAAAWMERLQAAQVMKLCGVRVFHQPETGVLLGETTRRDLRTGLRQTDSGHGRARKISAVSGLDLAQCDGCGRSAGHGEERPFRSRKTRGGGRHRAAVAGGRGQLAQAWCGNSRCSASKRPGAAWRVLVLRWPLNPRRSFRVCG